MSSVTDFLDSNNNILYGSFGDACILPSGEVALCTWHSGSLGVTPYTQSYGGIVLNPETGESKTLFMPNGESLIPTTDVTESLENYSGICITRTSTPTKIGLTLIPHWTVKQAVWIEYILSTSRGLEFYLEGLWGKGNNQTFYNPPNDPTSLNDGTFGGGVTLIDGRVLMWIASEFNSFVQPVYALKGIIYDPEINLWYWTQADITSNRHARTAQLLSDGKAVIFGGAGTPKIYDPVSDCSIDVGGIAAGLYTRCCCLHPDSGLLYFNGKFNGNSYLYAFDPSSNQFFQYARAAEDDLYPYNSMQPLPSGNSEIDRVILFPGDNAAVTTPKIVEFNKTTETFTYAVDTTDVGYGYSSSVYSLSGKILLVPSLHGISFKLYTPEQAYAWDKQIATSLYMGSK